MDCEWDGEPHPVANLSLGGFFTAAERPLPVGQVVALRLHLPTRVLDLEAKVAWRNEPPQPRNPALPSGFGVAIRRIELADKLALVEFLREQKSRGATARTGGRPRPSR